MLQIAQKIKDEYFTLISSAAIDMAGKYHQLKAEAEKIIEEINRLPKGLNDADFAKAQAILRYSEQRIQADVDIGFDVKDKRSRFTYSEMLSFIDLYSGKRTELEILKDGLIKELPPGPKPGNSITTTMPSQKLKVSEYKQWLHHELQKLAAVSDNDEIEIIKE